MRADDLPVVAALSAASFGFEIEEPAVAERWFRRVAHPLATDPHGGFVAERDGAVIGAAQALLRERLWCLSLLAVDQGAQNRGAGRALLERALAYGGSASAGLIPSSSDPRALRLYALAGFSLRPTFEAAGTVDRRCLPAPDARVREGGSADLEALGAISRDIRGAAHTSELEFALDNGARLLRLADRGFALSTPGHGVGLLVARDEGAAASLLWTALAQAGETDEASVRWITGEQQWAIDVLLRAGLELTPNRAFAVRGRPGPLHPFLPSGPFA